MHSFHFYLELLGHPQESDDDSAAAEDEYDTSSSSSDEEEEDTEQKDKGPGEDVVPQESTPKVAVLSEGPLPESPAPGSAPPALLKAAAPTPPDLPEVLGSQIKGSDVSAALKTTGISAKSETASGSKKVEDTKNGDDYRTLSCCYSYVGSVEWFDIHW